VVEPHEKTEAVAESATAERNDNRRSVKMKHYYKGNEQPRSPDTGAGAVLGKPEIKDFLCITTDTREQNPLKFDSEYVKQGVGTVPVFDYALTADEHGYSIERKSLPDFIQSVVLGKSWRRELAKIAKAQERLLPVVYVLEFSFDAIGTYDFMQFHSGQVTSQFVYRRVAELIFIHNVHLVFAGSREAAAYAVCLILKRRLESLRG